MTPTQLASLFLLAFSSLFPVIGPISTALIINPYFSDYTQSERKVYAGKIVFYSVILGVATIFLGSWVLKFMGVSVTTTQMAGGFIIAKMGLTLLNSGEADHKNSATQSAHKSLFYPFAFPLTVGPGAISVLITLSAESRVKDLEGTLLHLGTLCFALLSVLLISYLFYAYESLIIQRMGTTGSIVLNRLMAFFVFCVGIQMLLTGFSRAYPHVLE